MIKQIGQDVLKSWLDNRIMQSRTKDNLMLLLKRNLNTSDSSTKSLCDNQELFQAVINTWIKKIQMEINFGW